MYPQILWKHFNIFLLGKWCITLHMGLIYNELEMITKRKHVSSINFHVWFYLILVSTLGEFYRWGNGDLKLRKLPNTSQLVIIYWPRDLYSVLCNFKVYIIYKSVVNITFLIEISLFKLIKEMGERRKQTLWKTHQCNLLFIHRKPSTSYHNGILPSSYVWIQANSFLLMRSIMGFLRVL